MEMLMDKQVLEQLSQLEDIDVGVLASRIAAGEIVVVKNKKHNIVPLAIGTGTRVKVNANLGASTEITDKEPELTKLHAAMEAGADAVMDLSDGGDLTAIRQAIIDQSTVPVGTVPVYEAVVESARKYHNYLKMTTNDIMQVLKRQAEQGVDFFTIHSGITRDLVNKTNPNSRLGGVVSRGGALLTRWILENKKENPLYEHFDEVLDIAKEYDIALSLGDGMRPGALHDSLDTFQIGELYTLGELTQRAREKGVQVMIEGPGHVPLNEIETNMRMQKAACHNAPFYVLGPLVTDIALGYDHIAGAIGGAIAAMNGADFLCIVTPREHLGQPDAQDIREGVIASRIAAHAVDLLRRPQEKDRDRKLSVARRRRDWQTVRDLSLHPATVDSKLGALPTADMCSMCGEYCSLKVMDALKSE
jgi:phosphomethylpyrimidine synthase